ncbi:MAG: ATP-binding cassette domain-containing protein [Desulfoprunum sp.]|jgi:nickel transport system ATP-binding protein|uniref:ATP-binding cassette domain-containing protein n=1 Tax=Desulfoprunum sp. TaxID=2020866 RepID=UPI003C723D71
MNLLELDRVGKSYHRGGWFGKGERVPAVVEVTLTIPESSSIGLIGRSGAGKSTLGRIILGLEQPDSGTIGYRGKKMQTFTGGDWREFRREVQVVFQNALGSVNPRWPAMDIIAEPLRNFDDLTDSQLRRKIDFLLAMVGLEPSDADKYPHQFSGGQLQRICIARALALQPRLVILDEAVSSLDMLIQAQALRLLRRLQQQTGIAYLFVSHDIRIVAGFCDQVAVMHQGRITSTATDLSEAKEADDPILRQLARAVLPAWPEGWTHAENP